MKKDTQRKPLPEINWQKVCIVCRQKIEIDGDTKTIYFALKNGVCEHNLPN